MKPQRQGTRQQGNGASNAAGRPDLSLSPWPTKLRLLREFFEVSRQLRQSGLVRSGNLLGDIGESLVRERYGLELCKSCRNQDFEGYIEHEGVRYRVQVKVHNSTEGKNRNAGNPDGYDALLVLVGPDSFLRDHRVREGGYSSFHVYVFEPDEIQTVMHDCSDGTYSFAKGVLHAEPPFDVIAF